MASSLSAGPARVNAAQFDATPRLEARVLACGFRGFAPSRPGQSASVHNLENSN
jgi:hypothetical protein